MIIILTQPYNSILRFMMKEYNLEKEKQRIQIKITDQHLTKDILQLINDYAIDDRFTIKNVI